jgi:DNA replication protein DnaC
LAKEVILSLMQNNWIKGKQNVIITGPTGSGKTFHRLRPGQQRLQKRYKAHYIRLPRLLQEMHIARGDGSYGKLLTRLAKYALLIIDDWGLAKLSDKERRDLLEVLEDRHGISSTIISSQIPLDKWHDTIGDPTIADAVLDRLVHNAHMITMSMKAESMRKLMSKST